MRSRQHEIIALPREMRTAERSQTSRRGPIINKRNEVKYKKNQVSSMESQEAFYEQMVGLIELVAIAWRSAVWSGVDV